jgi:hypothetical protein
VEEARGHAWGPDGEVERHDRLSTSWKLGGGDGCVSMRYIRERGEGRKKQTKGPTCHLKKVRRKVGAGRTSVWNFGQHKTKQM